jgi:hypothetical protein
MYHAKVLSIAALLGTSLAQSSSDSAGNAECTSSYASILAEAPTPDGQLASAITSYASSLIGGGNGDVTAATNVPTPTNPLDIVTQVCSFASQLPASLQGDFSSYANHVISYVSAQSSNLDAVITNCVATGTASDQAAAYTSFVNSIATHTGPLCAAPTVGSNSTTTTTATYNSPYPTTFTTGGGGPVTTETGTIPTTTTAVPTGAAAAPTGMLANAAAVAGLLGAIALL